jgi:hypothetical protein
MKKLVVSLAFSAMLISVNAQIMTSKDFEVYDISQFDSNGDGKADYVEAALTIKELYGLDKSNSISRITILDSIPKTKTQLYVEVNNWFIHSFVNGESVIQLNEKEEGVIIGKGYVKNIASHVGFAMHADVHAWVIIRVDIKDTKIRITTTISEYKLDQGSGVLGAISSDTSTKSVSWMPVNYFPFVDAKSPAYKLTGAKAFVNCHIWSLVIADKLVEAVTHGITGAEDEAW